MGIYIAKRLLLILPTLLGAAALVFLIMRVIPGDVALLIFGGDQAGSIDPKQLAAMRPPLEFTPFWVSPWANFQQMVWPIVTVGYRYAAVTTRMTRSTVLEVLREDYIRTAWAKGLQERAVVIRHALKNSMLPVITLIGTEFAFLIGGLVVTETVFTLNGVGRFLVDAVAHRDYPVVLAHATASADLAPRLTVAEEVAKFVRTKPLGAIGAAIILGMLGLALFAGLLAPYDPYNGDYGQQFARPSAEHWFGTDEFGRDVLSRIMYGARIALFVGFVASFTGCTIGGLLGVISAYWGGKVDLLLERLMDIMLAFPQLILALAIASILGPAVQNVVIAISIPVIPRVARVVRSAALSVKEHVYVEAVQALGATRRRVILQHIIPNVMAPYIIMVTAQLGAAILAEAALSYLGLGAAEPTPSWGLMLSGSAPSYAEKAPWIALFPGIAISLGVFGFNLFGDSLRDALDPKLRKG